MAIVGTLAVTMAACSSSSSSSTTTTPGSITALVGKRIPGTGTSWTKIANGYTHPANVGGTSIPPVSTFNSAAGSGEYVSFFQFSDSAAAAAFYSNPPVAARLFAEGIQGFEPTAGATSVAAPSKWLDLRQCDYSSSNAVASVVGEPSGGKMDAAGNCSTGTPSSVGFATVTQRGNVVVLVSTFGGGPDLGIGITAAIASTVVAQNMKLTASTVAFMASAGVR
jgi:hypothetical protein